MKLRRVTCAGLQGTRRADAHGQNTHAVIMMPLPLLFTLVAAVTLPLCCDCARLSVAERKDNVYLYTKFTHMYTHLTACYCEILM